MFRISGAGLYFNNCLLFDYWCDFCNFRRRNRQIKEALTIIILGWIIFMGAITLGAKYGASLKF